MIRTYEEAVQYLYNNLPMFQRVGASAFKKDLTNTIKLCEHLGNPQHRFKSIHVGGTNGKGSTSHMLASVFQEAGYKTGLYTSPHLKSFTERIRVNGREVEKDFVVNFANRIQPAIEQIRPSFFEITVAMAFEYFAEMAVDIAIIEVGLGGRLDSTNVILPELSVITNIGFDHKDLLGDTLPKIAFEKAGIIKKDTPIVISQRQSEVQQVFISKAIEENADIAFASDLYNVTLTVAQRFQVLVNGDLRYDNLALPLLGNYQKKNLAGVLRAVDVMKERGWELSNEAIRIGLEHTVINTGLKGRWQKINDMPLIICDTGHNIDGIREIIDQINTLSYRRLHVIFGVVKDKEVDEILALLPKQAAYYFCESKLPRALPAQILHEKALAFGLQGAVIPDVNEAKAQAIKNASSDDFIFIGGSTFVVAELNEL